MKIPLICQRHPKSSLFPVENFKLVLNEVLDRDRGNAFDYQDSQGYYLCVRQSAFCSKKEKLRVMRKIFRSFPARSRNRYNCQSPVEAG